MKRLYKARQKRLKRGIEYIDNGESFFNVAILHLKWDLTFSVQARSTINRRSEPRVTPFWKAIPASSMDKSTRPWMILQA